MTSQDDQSPTQNNNNDTDLPGELIDSAVVETLNSFSTNSLETVGQNNSESQNSTTPNSEEESELDYESHVKALLIDQIGSENFSNLNDSDFFSYEWLIENPGSLESTYSSPAYVKEFICFSVNNVIINHVLKEYKFGDYNVRIEVNREIETRNTSMDPVRLLEPGHYGGWAIYVAREDGSTRAIHPHVSIAGILCVGGSRQSIPNHLDLGNYDFIALMVDQMLRNYSESSPHYQIENFESGSVECQVCGHYKVEYEKVKRNTICLDCVADYCTDDFGVKDMPEKMEFCSACGKKSSTGKFTNSKCDTFLCKPCQTEGNSRRMFPVPTLDESRFNYVGQEHSNNAPF